MNQAAHVAVIYYSATGNVHGLARALVEGAEGAGAPRPRRRVRIEREQDGDQGDPKEVRSVAPHEVWALLQRGETRLLDLRTTVERRRYGAPPGAIPVSLARHALKPEGEGAIYLCQHAVRSKATLRNGAAEVAGGFVAWQRAGLPIARVK